MASVGIIANPSAGKDIRRLVAQGRFVPNHEKINILKRVFVGLQAAGVKEVVMINKAGARVRTVSRKTICSVVATCSGLSAGFTEILMPWIGD